MNCQELKSKDLPDRPGVYFFKGLKGKILYIGKATSLRDRVRSYFRDDVLHTRGKHIVDMVTMAKTIAWRATDSVLEALILEAALIKRHQPIYNTKEKDNKSFNYVVITEEEFPRVLLLRERTLLPEVIGKKGPYRVTFGPFPSGPPLREALVIIRKIFPYRDTCEPGQVRPCFNYQIGLCPGVCVGAITRTEYAKTIGHIRLFFEGKKKVVVSRLKKEMAVASKKLEFERAGELKKMIFALEHLKDASLVGKDIKSVSARAAQARHAPYRIEAYDIAHISGTHTVGVMVVVEDGEPNKKEYRKFKIENVEGANDTLHLEQVLRRRFGHPEWRAPDLIVVDGSTPQKRRAEKVIAETGRSIAVASVVKDERHKPKALMGKREQIEAHRLAILLANAEAHRFAVKYHRLLREKLPRK